MALTPEVQSLIDILHEETRDEAWQARVQDSYEAAQTTLNMTDESVARAVLREVLRQNVDDAILDDVLDAAKADSAEAFAQNIHEKAQSWDGAEINPRLEIEIAKDPRQLGEEFNGAGPQLAEKMRSAAVSGELSVLIATLRSFFGMQGSEADHDAPTPDDPSAEFGVMDVSMTSEGQNLFNYIDEVLTEGNRGVIYDIDNPPADGQLRNSLTPAEMESALRTSIERDIEAGTFPIAGLGIEDADAIVKIINEVALEKIEPTSGKDLYDNTYYSYDPSNNDLRAAVNAILTGDQAVVPQQMAPVINQNDGQIMDAKEYGDIFADLVNKNPGVDAQGIIDHFRQLVEGRYESSLPDRTVAQLEEARTLVDQYTGVPVPDDQAQALKEASDLLERYADHQQFVPPIINIPEDKHEAFYAKIEEAYEIAARPNEDGTFNRDADAFGQIMAEDFQYALPSGARESIRHEIYDHGGRVHVRLGEQTENSIAAIDENGAQLFEFANFMEGESFSVYGVRGDVDHPVMEEVVADLDNINDVRALFGDEFDIRVVSEPDVDMDHGNTKAIGYYISSENGNSFYVGFDAIPEENVSATFREARSRELDTQSREALPSVDYSIGQEERPSVAEFNV